MYAYMGARCLPTEIRAGMYQPLQGNEAGLIAYWRFDEGTGTIIRDQTANHNDGTLVNGPTWAPGHVPAPVAYTYNWDTSGFFGLSDNVVFRLEAYPDLHPRRNSVPGPYQHPYASATTFPFRVRGTQVQVYRDAVQPGNESAGATVYQFHERTIPRRPTDGQRRHTVSDRQPWLPARPWDPEA